MGQEEVNILKVSQWIDLELTHSQVLLATKSCPPQTSKVMSYSLPFLSLALPIAFLSGLMTSLTTLLNQRRTGRGAQAVDFYCRLKRRSRQQIGQVRENQTQVVINQNYPFNYYLINKSLNWLCLMRPCCNKHHVHSFLCTKTHSFPHAADRPFFPGCVICQGNTRVDSQH